MISDKNYFIKKQNILEQIISHGIKEMTSIMEQLMNEAMLMERKQATKADLYERTDDRQGYANGFKERNFQTRSGPIKIRIPQVRGISFYPKSLEKGERSDI